jgi:hypothetical protein
MFLFLETAGENSCRRHRPFYSDDRSTEPDRGGSGEFSKAILWTGLVARHTLANVRRSCVTFHSFNEISMLPQ